MNYHKIYTHKISKTLLLASAAVTALVALRIGITHGLKNLYLVWNLFLAAIPYVISHQMQHRSITPGKKYFWVLVIIWLAFLPNAPYIITDFVHLQHVSKIPMWYDYSLIFLTSITGLLYGTISMIHMRHLLLVKYPLKYIRLSYIGLFPLVAYGIYLGRFIRLNSWDIFVRPIEVFVSIKGSFCLETFAFIAMLSGALF